MALKDHSSCSWRLVAYPDRTGFLGDYYLFAGHPTRNGTLP